MSASTAAAPVPEPNSTPSGTAETTPQNSAGRGLLASMVAPVEPVRTAFNLTSDPVPTTSPEGAPAAPADGVSSGAFHDDAGTNNSTGGPAGSGTSDRAQTGIWRAWLIAGATRWGRGGGTANKRLDMHKARAQAQQVKETRQVTINRTPAPLAGSRGAGTPGPAGGKGLNQKAPTGNTPKGAKNTGPADKGNGRGPAGRGNTGGPGNAGPAGRSTGGSGRGGPGTESTAAPKPKPIKTPKPGKAPAPAPAPAPAAKAGGTAGSKGAPGAAGKDGSAPKTPAPTKGATGAKAPDTTPGTKNTTSGDIPAQRKKWSLEKGPKSDKAPKPAKKPGKANITPKPANVDTNSTKKTHDKAGGGKTAPTGTKPLSTRSSRETGYRDGARAAHAAAHARAYRDGVKDGWAHTMAAAEQEKTALDQARDNRMKARQETPVTTAPLATSTDHHTGPQPIPVNGINTTHLSLGEGANRANISRAEVRSLKGLERRLTERRSSLQNIADLARQLQAHADGQAQQAQSLMERAQGVKGGDKLTGTLARLHEDAKAQAAEAAEVHKRAVRSADACTAALANVATRYDGMYQAVVDSPETIPAELAYYQGA